MMKAVTFLFAVTALTTGSAFAAGTAWPASAKAQPRYTSGSPEEHLPPAITQLTGFGERPVVSLDGKRVAFMAKSFGDAFEIDLGTHLTRLLTGRFRHAGFLRVHYLPNGDYFLIGARDFKDIRTTRSHDQEMWVMNADARSAPVSLGQKINEGVAISRSRLRIAWANTHGQYPELLPEGESVMYVADVAYVNGVPQLANKKEVLRAHWPDCSLEAQDFRRDDTELVYVCYRKGEGKGDRADVFGLNLASGAVTTFRKIADEYNEVEGVSPDGQWALVESSREQGPDRQDSHHIDLWKLRLEPNSTDFSRMTRWGDYDGYKASNPVVSPDGKWFTFQSARSNDPAGVGYGIFQYRMPGSSTPLGAGSRMPPRDSTTPTVFHIGDSTVRNGSGTGGGGQWGWGDLTACYFDTSRVQIANRALGGRSSRTYITEGRWDNVLSQMKAGDVVTIQFGHNDGGAINDTSRARGTLRGIGEDSVEIDNLLTRQREVVHSFGWYLRKYIADTRAKGAIPVIASLVPRNRWTNGLVQRSKDSYAGWAEQVALAEGADFIDLNERIAHEYDALGEEAVMPLFAPDRTHTTLEGAKFSARVVIAALRALPHNPVEPYLLDETVAHACAR